jgi:hypothetical protein
MNEALSFGEEWEETLSGLAVEHKHRRSLAPATVILAHDEEAGRMFQPD